MTCKDLMVGDYVTLSANTNARMQVVSIMPMIINTVELADIDNHGAIDEYPVEALSGIPITPEILMKSGWFWDTKCAKVNHDERFVLEYYPQEGTLKDVYYLKSGDNCDVFKSKPGLIYLHQLQHAMRLCNIEKDITL